MHNKTTLLPTLVLSIAMLPCLAVADELTQIIQQDLMTLGYDPGSTDGEATVATVIAISKFQSENGLAVTGDVDDATKAKLGLGAGAPAVTTAPAPAALP